MRGEGGDRSKGVKRAYTLLFLLVMELIEELGSDRALEMLKRAEEKIAVIFEKEFRSLRPSTQEPLKMGIEAYRAFMEESGAEIAIHGMGEASAALRVGRCPFYEALLDVGVDCGYLQGALCSNMILPAIQEILKRIDPRLGLRTRITRQSIDEFCIEEILLE